MKKLLMIPVISFLSINLNAQIGFVSLNNKTIFNFPDTVYATSNVNNAYVILQNKSNNQTFNGSVQLIYALDTSGMQNYVVLDTFVYNSLTLVPQDTVSLIFNPVNVNVPPYKYGAGNVVVVWPITVGWSAIDSAKHHLTVLPLTSVEEINFNKEFTFANPVLKNSRICVDTRSSIWYLFSLDGKIYQLPASHQGLTIPGDLPNGIYILQETRKTSVNRWKIIITD